MASDYNPRRFFRQVPNRFLQQYFAAQRVLCELDFAGISEAQVEPIYEAWLSLPEPTRKNLERDFKDVADLATEAGSKAILDAARREGEDLAAQFASLGGFCEHAFWTLLERPGYLEAALAFNHADTLPTSYWRKRKNIPRKTLSAGAAAIQRFEQAISGYFHKMQGRGANCKIDYYQRDGRDCFFAYPEDYAQASEEWVERQLERRPRRPAFELIFVYSQADGTLDIYLSGDRKPIPDLQSIFASVWLGTELPPDEKDERVYDLAPLRSPHFSFTYGPESGILDVAVKKLRAKIPGRNERIVLEADVSEDRQAVFALAKKSLVIPLSQLVITQVGIQVTFAPSGKRGRCPTRSFEVSWPNSCSLKHGERDSIVRKMLADSGIEPRESSSTRKAS